MGFNMGRIFTVFEMATYGPSPNRHDAEQALGDAGNRPAVPTCG